VEVGPVLHLRGRRARAVGRGVLCRLRPPGLALAVRPAARPVVRLAAVGVLGVGPAARQV
ncbi:MAG: hypothetical protein AVDCRST_MAG64-763, partial [uncultured Phycisphaerae bacterium]